MSISTTKPFDPSLFNSNDARARAAVLHLLHSQGVHAIENDDLYGPDIVVYKGYIPSSYIEVEIKQAWGTSLVFPFSTVQLAARKGKYLRKRLSIEYWLLNPECNRAIIIPDFALDSSQLVEVANRYVESGEQFYRVPVDQCIIRDLTSNQEPDTASKE